MLAVTASDPQCGTRESSMTGQVEVALFGTPQLRLPEGKTHTLERRDAAVLAYLAFEGATTRNRLVELLWPDNEPEAARNTLRQRLFQLKKRAGREVVSGAESLAPAPDVVMRAVDDSSDASLLDGHDFSDCPTFDEWLKKQRNRLSNRRRDSLIALADDAENGGHLAAALAFAEELLAREPLHEDGYRRLMRLHYLRGDRAAALLAFDRCEQVLKDELSARPGNEMLALLKTVESSGVLTVARKPTMIPLSMIRPPRLIGRKRELEAMREVWASGRAFLLLGEAGMGKTRLLSELAASTSGSVYVQGRPGDYGVPYAVLTRLLRKLIERMHGVMDAAVRIVLARLLPELGEAPGGGRDAQRALQLAIEALVHSAARSHVANLFVDDLHFADDASLETLRTLALAESSEDVRWAFAQRPDEGSAAALAVRDTLVEAGRLELLILAPFDEAEMVELVTSLDVTELKANEAAPILMRHTGGNPLFALETLKHATMSGSIRLDTLPRPSSVGQLVQRRLHRLSPLAVSLARAAAIATDDFSVALAASVTEVNALALADAWQELETAQVLRGDAFAHDLVYEAVLATVPPTIAKHLHRSVASWLHENNGLPARIALHYSNAGLPAEAAEHWLRSAQAAHTALRFGEATDAFEHAAHGFFAAGHPELAFDAALGMRQASFEVDLSDRSGTALELLERFASTPAQRARAHNERAVVRLHQGDLVGTEQSTHAGLRELGGANEPLLRAELRRNLAAVCAWRNDTNAALSELRSIQYDVERLGTELDKFNFWDSLAIVLHHADQSDEAERTHRRAIEAAIEIGNLAGAAQAALNLVVTLHDAGRLHDALAAVERAREMLAAAHVERLSYSSLNLNYGFVLRGLGEYVAALEHLRIAIENFSAQSPGWLPLVSAHRAQLFMHLGQFARAQQDLDAAVPDDSSPALSRSKWIVERSALSAALGKSASQEIDLQVAQLPKSGRRVTRWRLQRARLAHLSNSEAVECGSALLREVVQSNRIGLAISVGALLAPRVAALGHDGEARTLAREALERMRTCAPDDAYRGDVWWNCCKVLGEEFNAELQQSVRWIHETARLRVPAEFRDSFLNRNLANRELIRAATRRIAVE